ncbi:conserved exported hypothetical protein [Flavobacterium sp. 9AF]|uniref:T9SS type A sorting domain-containing protein n=1 Tax=Flavobacterium sp. 9AF TaxID=2653142 RepID=UPI0012F22D3A|nr:T9SS type A sorting domain-containing protein [Flavobacterium sp. 9AF]VXB35399.1 conserved exported hypothetical protein [Flavobacterium sp. 9AF]
MRKTITLFLLLYLSLSYSQESIVFSGGNAVGSNGSVSYSYGQVFYETVSGANGELTQGVQQPIEIYTLSIPNPTTGINLALYPNPAITQVTLELTISQFPNEMKYELFDVNGKLIKSEKILSNQTAIDIESLPIATYFLNVFSSNQILKTFKLIKNN